MLVDDLYDIGFNAATEPKLTDAVKLLKSAIIDWPVPVNTVDEYIQEIKLYLNCTVVTLAVINARINPVNMKEAWQAESLTGIIELMRLYPEESLVQILERIALYLSSADTRK